jgi:hypothetical protein
VIDQENLLFTPPEHTLPPEPARCHGQAQDPATHGLAHVSPAAEDSPFAHMLIAPEQILADL